MRSEKTHKSTYINFEPLQMNPNKCLNKSIWKSVAFPNQRLQFSNSPKPRENGYWTMDGGKVHWKSRGNLSISFHKQILHGSMAWRTELMREKLWLVGIVIASKSVKSTHKMNVWGEYTFCIIHLCSIFTSFCLRSHRILFIAIRWGRAGWSRDEKEKGNSYYVAAIVSPP